MWIKVTQRLREVGKGWNTVNTCYVEEKKRKTRRKGPHMKKKGSK